MAIFRDINPTKRVSAEKTVINRAVNFSSFLDRKACPGNRTLIFGTGKDMDEALAFLLADSDVRDAVASILLDVEQSYAMVAVMFPNKKTSYLQTNDAALTTQMLADYLREAIEKLGYSGRVGEYATIVITEFLSRLLAETHVFKPVKGYLKLYDYMDAFVNAEELMRYGAENSIEELLAKVSFRCDLRSQKRLTLNMLQAMVAPKLRDIGDELSRSVLPGEQAMRDALIMVRWYLDIEQRGKMLPEELLDDENLRALASNLTFALASMDKQFIKGSMRPRTVEHRLDRALALAHAMLKKSLRFQMAPLSALRERFSHTRLVGPRSELKGVVVSQNLTGEVRTQVSKFLKAAKKEGVEIYHQQPTKEAETMLDSVLSGFMTKVTGAEIQGIAEELYSSVVTSTPKPFVVGVCCNELEIMHYAVALAEKAVIMKDVMSKATTIHYLVDVGKQNYRPSSGITAGQVILTDPAEAILCLADHEATIEVHAHIQGVPDSQRDAYYWGDPEEKTIQLNKPLVYATELAGKNRVIETSIQELLGIYESDQVRVMIPIVNAYLMDELLQVMKHFDMTRRAINPDNDVNIDPVRLQMHMGMRLNNVFRALYDTPIGSDLVNAIYYKIMTSDQIEPGELDEVRESMYIAKKRLEMQMWTTLMILAKAGYINYDDHRFILDIVTSPYVAEIIAGTSDFKLLPF
jgi:hypothetical protein